MGNLHDLVILPQTEAEYTAWVEDNKQGFIINAPKHGNADMLWHRADCGHIKPASHPNFVEGPYLKACSTHAGALAVWAKEQPQQLKYCKFCQNATTTE